VDEGVELDDKMERVEKVEWVVGDDLVERVEVLVEGLVLRWRRILPFEEE